MVKLGSGCSRKPLMDFQSRKVWLVFSDCSGFIKHKGEIVLGLEW